LNPTLGNPVEYVMVTANILESESLPATIQKQRLRVGVLLDSQLVPKWVRHILEEIENSTLAELAAVVAGNHASPTDSITWGESTPVLLRLWSGLDRRLFAHRSARGDTLAPVLFTPKSADTRLLTCNLPADSGSGGSSSEAALKVIAAMQLDVLLNLSSSPSSRRLQQLAKHGLWWFSSDHDLLVTLFWMLYENNPVLENTLNISSSRFGTATIPCSYSAADRYSFFRNYTNGCWKRAEAVARCLAQLHRVGWQRTPTAPATLLAQKHATPGTFETARLIPRLVKRIVRGQLTRSLMRERWFIAFRKVHRLEDSKAGEGTFTLILPPRGRFYADPFVIDKGDMTYVFFEDCSYRSGKAVISFVEINAAGQCSSPEVALEESFHLAYPCLFQSENEIYLLPETKNNRTVQLYQATDFPRHWRLSHVLFNDVSAVDSSLLRHDGKFWLFSSGLGSADPWVDWDSQLFLFFADSLLGPWKAHPGNPIAADVRNCRCAGQIIRWGDRLVRPAQDCSTVYGHTVFFNQINILSETDYHETPIGTISSHWVLNNRGTHTYNRSDKYEVLDGRTLSSRLGYGSRKPRFETVTPLKPLITRI
jgi:hypothetical protein